MRYFNTSGPNNPVEHYTLFREDLLEKGKNLVFQKKYFTIWAPRQTGKSTYFRLLAKELEKEGYEIAHINFEDYHDAPLSSFLNRLQGELRRFWNFSKEPTNISDTFYEIQKIKDQKFVLIIDEVEGINTDYLGTFLHSIRNAYHSRNDHSLQCVILVDVSNITGIMQDYASPFNISDEFNVPYFSDQETVELLTQHETETGQLFAREVKQKISEITGNQPGLVNGFAKQLVDRNPEKPIIEIEDFEQVEGWYLTEAIDKNIANIIKVAKQHRSFAERILFKDERIPFDIDRPAIEKFYVNGLIKKDQAGYIRFWVPLYRKRLFKALYPYSNGETTIIQQGIPSYDILTEDGNLHFDKLIDSFKAYIKRRSFRPFRERDEKGKYKSIPEAVMIYSFETFIQSFLEMVNGKSYREVQLSLGNSDLVINILGTEYLIETKIYRYDKQFQDGKKQLAYYCNRLGIKTGVYLVFVPNNVLYPHRVKEGLETIEGVEVQVFLVEYDQEKDF